METYRREDGTLKWQWDYLEDGTVIWTQYFPNGQINSKSYWKNSKCHGLSQIWDDSGNLVSSKEFFQGKLR